MVELKTLKDIEINDRLFQLAQAEESNNQIIVARNKLHPEGDFIRLTKPIVISSELRQEAIRDIKALYQKRDYTLKEAQKSPNSIGCCTNYPLCSMGGGFLVCSEDKEQIEPIIKYIMWKFNITEEDLK